jgi:hypothetical protein
MTNPSPDIPAVLAGEDTFSILRALRVEGNAILELQRSLVEGSSAGETIPKLADRVQAITKVDRGQAVRVARNVIGFVLSKVRWEQAVSVGMTHKTWICPSNCPIFGHAQASERYSDPIPLSEPFIVNNVPLMYPRDFLSGHIDECVDCQCMMFTRILFKTH